MERQGISVCACGSVFGRSAWLRGVVLLVACLALTALVLSAPAGGAELRTYSPPVQQQQLQQQSLPPAVQPQQQLQQPAEPDIYTRFSLQVQGLTPVQKSALSQSFSTRLTEAQQQGDWSRAAHYSRLLAILNQ